MGKLLQELGKGQGFVKAGFLGFQKSGKTWTAALLAAATRQVMSDRRPIAMYDTEGGSEYIRPMITKLTGQPLLGIKSRSFTDLLEVANEAKSECSVLLVDSVTHIWRGLCDSYLAGINEQRKKAAASKGWSFKPKTALEFQDWGPLKAKWAEWTDLYLNLPLHIIICGRAGFEYDKETNEETGKKELVKTGTKMKTEAEFGFEPSLLVEMQAEEVPDRDGGRQVVRTALVKGDRFNLIDGTERQFASHPGKPELELKAVMDFFAPHLQSLTAGAHTDIRMHADPMEVDESGDSAWAAEKRARTILSEEIQGELVSAIPGQSADDKKRKADLMQKVFGTRSWSAIESMDSGRLRDGLRQLKAVLGTSPGAPAPAKSDMGNPVSQPATPASTQTPTADDDLPFGNTGPAPAEATKPTPRAPVAPARAAVPRATAPPTPPPAPVDGTPALLDDDTVGKIEMAIGEHAFAAIDYLVEKGYLKQGAPLNTLSAAMAKRIISQRDAFIRAVTVSKPTPQPA